jgi:hypothetical protein
LICNRDVDRTWFDTIRKELKEQIGANMIVEIKVVNEIELTKAGKQRFIVSEVVQKQEKVSISHNPGK